MRIGGIINFISNRNAAIINHRLKKVNLSHSEARVINQIHQHSSLSQDKLTKILQVDKSAVTRILKSMEKKQLIIRKVSQSDKRGYDIELTRQGDDLFNDVDQAFMQTSALMVEGLNEAEQKELRRLLEIVAQNMEVKHV